MASQSSHCALPAWLLNYIYMVGITSPIGGVLACAFGATVPSVAFMGMTWMALATLQCASGKQLVRDTAALVRAWRGGRGRGNA
jgi:hypothetical protein